MADPVPPVDYSSRDYASLVSDMKDAIETRLPEWKNRGPNDFGIILLELFAYLGDNLSFYADRIANEAYLDTAVRRGSVYAIAKMLDYQPGQNAAASTTLNFTLMTGSGSTTIPAGTQASTVGTTAISPIVFETDADLTIAGNSVTPAVYSGTVSATQGQTYSWEAIGISDGSLSQSLPVLHAPVIDGSQAVSVDEGAGPTTWRYIDHLLDAGPIDTVYSTDTDENGILSILFGDNVNGRAPVRLATIRATYRVGGGAAGNVGQGTLTQLVVSSSGLSVTNTTAATGGADAEALAQIRQNAPQALSALDRAVTVADYAALALRASTSVAKAKAEAGVYTNVSLYIAPSGGGVASTALKAAVLAFLASRQMINATVTIADPTYVPINITVSPLAVLPQYKQSAVKLAVENALAAMLAFDNVNFGDKVSLSRTYRAINDVAGIDYAVVTLLSRTGSGLGDVQLSAFEIPTAGTITTVPSGGVP